MAWRSSTSMAARALTAVCKAGEKSAGCCGPPPWLDSWQYGPSARRLDAFLVLQRTVIPMLAVKRYRGSRSSRAGNRSQNMFAYGLGLCRGFLGNVAEVFNQ